MLSVWAVKMRLFLCLLLATACALADKNENRRNKLPFVADALGNTLPPPSNVPATVGSPVNLLSPDRYEFYTFDESGELVKRLMTLEEIQAIVAAGEETEGLVTFADENQPTVSFNVNQPPYTKVHSVVTNVQNVLKAQMEAHKNKPYTQPTLDTPDVSDSWSLILPNIFGNTGVDIILDKTSGGVTTPETETFEENIEDEENSLSKEGNNQVLSSTTKVVTTERISVDDKNEIVPVTKDYTKTTTTTTPKPTTAKRTTAKPTTVKLTTAKSTTAKSTTAKSTTAKFTTTKPTTAKSTTAKLTTVKSTTGKSTTPRPTPTPTAKITTASPTTAPTTTENPKTTTKPVTTTSKFFATASTRRPLPSSFVTKPTTAKTNATKKPVITTSSVKPTTHKPVIRTTVKVTTTTLKPEVTTKRHDVVNVSPITAIENENILIQSNSNAVSSTDKNGIEFEKFSTFIPVSTVNYVTERTTTISTKSPVVSTTKKLATTSITTNAPTTHLTKTEPLVTTTKPAITTTKIVSTSVKDQENEKFNATTITTQSVSPSTTVSSTEFLSADKVDLPNNIENKPSEENGNIDEKLNDPLLLFDVAQSFSQIASDLGGSYQPIPTTSNLLDTTKNSELDLESKENVEMDIPTTSSNETALKMPDIAEKINDNFIKISTIDPHDKNEDNKPEEKVPIDNTIVDKKEDGNEYENSTTNIKNNNIIIDTVQKVKFTNTQATTEPSTIDPFLSESMGDLLSQVVNQAPSVLDGEKTPENEAKIIATEKTPGTTTTEIIIDPEIKPQTSNKVKKDTITTSTTTTSTTSTSTTTERVLTKIDSPKTDDENDVAKQTEKSEMKNVDKASETNDIKIQESEKTSSTESNDQNFVQISGSATRENSKEEPKDNESVTKESTTINNTDLLKKVTEAPEPSKINDENKSSLKNVDDKSSSEITTPVTNLDTQTTTEVIKINPSELNSENTKDENNTIKKKDQPELLSKVDDFKKKIQKINIDEEELINERNNSWKLIPTLSPPKANEILKDKLKFDNQSPDSENKEILLDFSNENQGLEVTTKDLGEDLARFSELSNELAFRYWNVIVEDIDKRRSFVFSPYSTFSMLAMIFMGAKGATSGEMNEILKLDDMVTFNPHFTLKNISDSIETSPQSGVAVSAFIKELYSDRNKGKILTFYKERAQHFYNGHVEEINFKLISDIIRRRTNLLVKRYSWGKIPEYMKTNNIVMQPPLAAFTANIFQTDCSGTSVEGRDGEMYFVVSPNVRQRRLVPVPAVVFKKGFLAGYDPVLDATVAALGNTNSIVSTMFLMPGQHGNAVHADDLEKLEQRLLDASPTTPTWNRVLRTLLPRTGLELQIPRFSHKSTFNTSLSLKKMGLKDLFDVENADLGGLNGPSKDLYLSDMVQLNTFVTCGEGVVGEQHHIEEYPETLTVAQRRRARWLNYWDEPRDYQRAFHDPHDISDAMHLPLHLRPRQARLPARSAQAARLKFDRPFLYFVRHNPSGMILYFGRYNPRLLP